MIGTFNKEEFIRITKYICSRCNRVIVNCYDDRYALRAIEPSNEKICAYCKLVELKDRPLTEEEIAFEEFMQNSISEVKYFQPYKESDDVRYIETENNLAAVYKSTFDEKFLFKNNANNPFLEYYLQKEVLANFDNLSSYDDYKYRYLALVYISECEETHIYNDEIKQLEQCIQPGDRITTKKDDAINSLQDIITNDLIDRLSNVTLSLYSIDDNAKKEEYVISLIELLRLIEDKKYLLNHEIIDISNLSDLDSGISFVHSLSQWLGHFQYELMVLFFEFWKISNNERGLLDCLKLINNYFETYYFDISFCNKHFEFSELNNCSCTDYLGIIDKIINEFHKFYSYYNKKFYNVPFDGIYRNMREKHSTKIVKNLRFDESGELTEESFILILINTLEILKILYIILNALMVKLEIKSALYNAHTQERDLVNIERSSLTNMINQLNGPYDNIIKTFYENKLYLKPGDINEQNKILLGIKTTIEFFNELEKLDDLSDAFLMISKIKSSVFASCVDDTILFELEELMNIFIDKFNSLIHKKHNLKPEFLEIELSLKQQMEKMGKFQYVSEDIFNTLVTAEFLFNLFVGNEGQDKCFVIMDYSCISILYYTALENALNTILYQGYMEILRDNGFEHSNSLDKYEYILNDFFAIRGKVDIIKGCYRKNKLCATLPLGNLARFFSIKYNKPKHLMDFYNTVFCLPKDKVNTINNLFEEVNEISFSRNNAAHGGSIIKVDDVRNDKRNVYEIGQVRNCRRVLFKFLELLK